MSDSGFLSPPPPAPAAEEPAWPLERTLAHLVELQAVDPKLFVLWATHNPGGVWQLIRSLMGTLPNDTRKAALAALAQQPKAEASGWIDSTDAEILALGMDVPPAVIYCREKADLFHANGERKKLIPIFLAPPQPKPSVDVNRSQQIAHSIRRHLRAINGDEDGDIYLNESANALVEIKELISLLDSQREGA